MRTRSTVSYNNPPLAITEAIVRRLGPALSLADVDSVFLSVAEWGKEAELQSLAFSAIDALVDVAPAHCVSVVRTHLGNIVSEIEQETLLPSQLAPSSNTLSSSAASRLFLATLTVRSARVLDIINDRTGECISRAVVGYLRAAAADLTCMFALCGILAGLPRRCIDAQEAVTGLFRVLSTPNLISDETADDPDAGTVSMVDRVVALYSSLWLDDAAGRLILVTLQAVYEAAVQCDSSPSLIVMAPLIRVAPEAFISIAAQHIASSAEVSDDQAADFLMHMIDWLRWPGSPGLHIWILAFLTELASRKRFAILVRVTQEAAPRIVSMLGRQHTQQGGLIVLTQMLLNYQHSPSVFHKIIPALSDLMPVLAAQAPLHHESKYSWPLGAESAVDALSALACAMMELHQGYPDIYSPLLERIAPYYHPAADIIHGALDSSAWAKRSQGDSIGSAAT